MKLDETIDYQAAVEQFRKEEHLPDNPVRDQENAVEPSWIDGYVDYQAAIKAWDKAQNGKYIIF